MNNCVFTNHFYLLTIREPSFSSTHRLYFLFLYLYKKKTLLNYFFLMHGPSVSFYVITLKKLEKDFNKDIVLNQIKTFKK